MDTFTHSTGDGAEHRFAHLSLYDVFGDPAKAEVNGFVPRYRKKLKAEALENMRQAGLDKFEIAAELNGFDAMHKKRDPRKAFLEFLQEERDAGLSVVRFSYAAANEGAAMPDTLPAALADEVCWILLEPFGIAPTKGTDAPTGNSTSTYGDGAEGPNPQAPLIYPTTEKVSGETSGSMSA